MHGTLPKGRAALNSNRPTVSPPPDKIVGRKFGRIAKVLWPSATAPTIAAIASCSVRTAERYLAGEFEPPAILIAAAIVEMTRLQ
jgi:hypothetical protein